MRRLTSLACLVCLAGCATLSNETYYGNTTYRTPGAATAVDHEAAEANVVNILLAKQISPPLDSPLQALSVTLPPYPAYLLRAGVTGRVKVLFTVDTSGAVRNASVSGSPPEELGEIALRAVQKWKFAPPTRNGNPIDLRLTYTFNFTIK